MDILKMMGKARELQTRMGELQEELKTIEVTGESGAGSVVVRINGQKQLVGVTIDPALMKPEEKEILEDLIIAAAADAASKVEAEVQAKTQGMMGDMGIPPGFKLPFS